MFFSSCYNQTNGCKKIELSSDELEWFKNYVNGDTIFFQNQNNEIDTFLINFSKKQKFTSCNKFELGPYICK